MSFIDDFLTKEDKEFRHLLKIYPSQIENLLCEGAEQEFDVRVLLNEAKKKVRRAKFDLQLKENNLITAFWNDFNRKQKDNPNLKKPNQDEVKRKVICHSRYIEEMDNVFEAEEILDMIRSKLDSLLTRNRLLETLAHYKSNTNKQTT